MVRLKQVHYHPAETGSMQFRAQVRETPDLTPVACRYRDANPALHRVDGSRESPLDRVGNLISNRPPSEVRVYRLSKRGIIPWKHHQSSILLKSNILELNTSTDGRLWNYRQEGAAPLWKSLGDADLTGTVSVVKDGEDARLVAVSATGTVKTALYFADGALSSWTDLGGTAEGIPAVLLSTAHRLRIVIRNASGHISTKFQNLDGTWPTTWQQVGSRTAIGSPDTILDPPSGRTAIAVRGTDNTLYHIFETAPGSSSWGQWQQLNPDPDKAENAATDPTMTPVTGPNGTSYIIIFRNTDDLIQVYSRQLSPQRLGGSPSRQFVRSSASAPMP
ncbi:hypothetical protein [Micromonospora sp. NPDC092111]|uniref:hypothetical protein n=1 Tax=Micromonospora sp. NPDC092111 TaxID=3364289 RepID=UPI003823EE77